MLPKVLLPKSLVSEKEDQATEQKRAKTRAKINPKERHCGLR